MMASPVLLGLPINDCTPNRGEERDVSIASAAQIIPALRALGHEVFAVDPATGRLPPADERQLLASGVAPEPPSSMAMEQVRGRAIPFAPSASDIRSADVVFLALHGGAGEDGRLQAMLDLAGVAYTDGGFWCLEANSLPGMTATSLLPQAAKVAGISFPGLFERICRGATRWA